MKAALAEKVSADKTIDVARAAYLPQVDLLWQINRSTINNVTGLTFPQSVIPSISGPVLPKTDQSAWNSAVGVLASWRIFDFGQRAAKVDEDRQIAAAARDSYELTRLDVATATVNAYVNVLAAEALAQAGRSNLERLRSFVLAVNVLVQNKLRPEVDAEQAAAAEALGQTQLIATQTDVRLQRATLGKLVGQPGETLRLAAPAPPAGPTTSPATGDRIEQHPAALQAAARVRQQQAQLRAIEGAYAPRVDVLASAFARGAGRSPTGAFGSGSAGLGPTTGNWAVGLQVTLPIGSYPALHAEQQAEQAAIEAERDRYDQTMRDLEERLQQARASLDSTEAIARITPTGLVAARKAEEQQRARFRSGLATVVDVTVAEATLAQAESQDAIAQLNVWRALGVYAAASGDLAQLRTALAGHGQ